jgi:hypothetical protein
MIVLFILIWLAIMAIVFSASAYLLTVHVPTVVADPTNFGAWIWILIALWFVLGSTSAAANSTR